MDREIIPIDGAENRGDSVVLEQNIYPVVTGGPVPVDILGRQETVDQILDLLITLSDARSSCTFALNGKWGSGKTFLLNMLEPQLRDYQDGEKFIVFHYNCWQYDYYDEPLIAVVSALLDNIDEQTHILPGKVREKVQLGLNTAKQVLKKVACAFIENKVGIDADKLSEFTHEVQKSASEKFEKQHGYDNYYAFHKVIDDARKELSKLVENKTLVIVVDELDRCLPDYAIKILERLHHLFSELSNTVVILAIDRTQLDNAVAKIYGDSVDTSSYLKKFINFEIPLGLGKISCRISEKYDDFFRLFDFDNSLLNVDFSAEDYFAALFSGIDIRTQERLMDRIKMVHRLLFANEKKDCSFMCLELLILAFSQLELPLNSQLFRIDEKGDYGLYYNELVPDSLREYMRRNWKIKSITRIMPENNLQFQNPIGIPELIVWYSQELCGASKMAYLLPNDIKKAFLTKGYIDELKQVKQLLETIH